VKVELRPATAQDAEPIADLQIAAWQVAFTPILPDDYVMPEREAFLAVGGRPSVTTVAEVEGAVAGFCGHGPSRDEGAGPEEGEIRALFVHPDHWRGGVGTTLAANALERLRKEGYSEAMLWSFRDNEAANAFYERLGFARDGAQEQRGTLGHATVVRYRRAL
jgi:ribosomal protein S18 acetylase RimI-like enzyme